VVNHCILNTKRRILELNQLNQLKIELKIELNQLIELNIELNEAE
jgi:hypothetical protein